MKHQLHPMIHYNVWFDLKDGFDENEALTAAFTFLEGLRAGGQVVGFRILQHRGGDGKTKLLPYHAIIEFRDNIQFSGTFASQADRGIHTGLHGHLLTFVRDFQIEIFHEIPDPITSRF